MFFVSQSDEKNASRAALAAIEVERFVSHPTKVTALERTGQGSAETLIQRAKLTGQFGDRLQQHAEQRSIDLRCIAVS